MDGFGMDSLRICYPMPRICYPMPRICLHAYFCRFCMGWAQGKNTRQGEINPYQSQEFYKINQKTMPKTYPKTSVNTPWLECSWEEALMGNLEGSWEGPGKKPGGAWNSPGGIQGDAGEVLERGPERNPGKLCWTSSWGGRSWGRPGRGVLEVMGD